MKRVISMFMTIVLFVSMFSFGLTANAVSGSEIVNFASQFNGYPYVYGAAGPYSFDCSGLVKYVFANFGIYLPHGSSYFWNNPSTYGTLIGENTTANAKPGDVISWPGHMGIYTGDGYCINALNESAGVCYIKVNSFCDENWNPQPYKVIRINGVTDDTTIPQNPTNLRTSTGAKKFTTAESIELKWDSSSNATHYWIYMWKDGTEIYNKNMGNSTAFTSAPTSAGKYTFIVRSGNSAGYSGGISYTFTVVENKIPDPPTNLRTSTGETEFTTSESIRFDWNESERATNYWVYMWKDGTEIYYTNMGSSTSFTSAPTSAGNYTFIVRAGNTAGYSDTGCSYNFTVYDPSITHTITYNPNGGSGAPSSQTKTTGQSITLSSTKPTRSGYTFKCWNTKADGTGTNYYSGGSYSADANLTLYAQWTENTTTQFKVTYNANGGTSILQYEYAEEGSTITLTTPFKYFKLNYDANGGTNAPSTSSLSVDCLGWASSSTATSAAYKCGASYMPTSNVTLYAVWKNSVRTNLSSQKPVREGYTFLGWALDPNASEAQFSAGETVDVSGDATLYAVWGTESAKTGYSFWEWIIIIVFFGWIWYV